MKPHDEENRRLIVMKKMKILPLFVFLLSSAVCQAADTTNFNVGALIGFASFSSGGVSAGKFSFGARGGYTLNPNWELGFDWTFQSTVPSNSRAGYTSNLSLALVRADYHFVGLVDGLFAGVKIGPAFTNAAGLSGTSFAYGGEVGYDYSVMNNLTVGPMLGLVGVSAPTLNGFKGNSGTDFQALAAIKYHL
jgi:hypothetical protein